jgi:hypothetical protein
MQTIGHHTCLNKGGRKFVYENAPFLSEFYEKDADRPYLGQGYYFWDNNLEMAKEWGRSHCHNDYCILVADLIFKDDELFDLVGNREHCMKLISLQKKFNDYDHNRDTWELAKFIEFLKDTESGGEYPGVFPYKAVRAVDLSPKPKKRFFFIRGKRSFTNLDPRFIICIIDLNQIHLHNKKLFCY